MLRDRFERIRIVDFRGNTRAVRPAFVEQDQNVFDIETGVCFLIAEACGGDSSEARVEYADVWLEGAYTRADKLDLANAAAADGSVLSYRTITGTGMDRLTPTGFVRRDWPALDRMFRFRSNGIVTYRDPLAYAVASDVSKSRPVHWYAREPAKAAKEFKETLETVRPDRPLRRFTTKALFGKLRIDPWTCAFTTIDVDGLNFVVADLVQSCEWPIQAIREIYESVGDKNLRPMPPW